jgi:hypothetical protein
MLTPWFIAARYLGQGVANVCSTVSEQVVAMSDRVDAMVAAHKKRTIACMSESERQAYNIREAEQRREYRRQQEVAEAQRKGCLIVFFIVIAVPVLFIILLITNSRNETKAIDNNTAIQSETSSARSPQVELPLASPTHGPSVSVQPSPEQLASSTPQPSQRSDAQIETDAVHALDALKALKNDLITVTTIQCEVTLSGTVSNDASSELAEWTVSHVPGVTTVHNDLQLSQVDRNSPRPLAQLQKLMPEPAQSNTGVLHYHGPPVPTGGKVVFDLPNVALEHLRLAYDRSKWERVMMRNRDDTGWVVVLTSDQLGYQTRCDLTWEIVE